MKKKIFLVLFDKPEVYQTIVFLSKHLDENGFEVFLFKNDYSEQKKNFSINYDFGKKCKIFNATLKFKNFFFFTIINLIYFSFFCLFKYLTLKPKHVIFFNSKALYCQSLLNLFRNKDDRFIYHNFDFDIPKNSKSFKEKILIKIEFFQSTFSDFYVFPNKERSKIFQKYIKKKNNFFFQFMNCFPRKFKFKNSELLMSKYKKKFLNKKLVCHLGSIGPSHNIVQIVLASKYTDESCVIIIGGISVKNYSEYLKKIIKKNKLSKKVIIFENIKSELWYEILSYSKIGLCFYETSNLSHKYMAGTSQKFNNYLMCNKPMLVSNNNDFKKFKKKYDIFELTNSNDPVSIANSINNLFKNNKRYHQIQKNMNVTYNKKLNFEYQFLTSYKKIL